MKESKTFEFRTLVYNCNYFPVHQIELKLHDIGNFNAGFTAPSFIINQSAETKTLIWMETGFLKYFKSIHFVYNMTGNKLNRYAMLRKYFIILSFLRNTKEINSVIKTTMLRTITLWWQKLWSYCWESINFVITRTNQGVDITHINTSAWNTHRSNAGKRLSSFTQFLTGLSKSDHILECTVAYYCRRFNFNKIVHNIPFSNCSI